MCEIRRGDRKRRRAVRSHRRLYPPLLAQIHEQNGKLVLACLSLSRLTMSLTHLQTGHPMGTQKSAQLVLEYLVCNPKLVANAWRGKLYRFSSGSLFKRICTKLTEHLSEPGNSQKILKVHTIALFAYLRYTMKCS